MKPWIAVPAALLALTLVACGPSAPESEPEVAPEPEQEADHLEWGYGADNGPAVWGELSAEYVLCSQGTEQSPIDLAEATSGNVAELTFAYQPTELTILDNGHTIQVDYGPGSSIDVGGDVYELLQFHFHAPSEHTVDGRSFPLEMHLVHQNDAGELAVVGVLVEAGEEHAAFGPIWANVPDGEGPAQSVEGVTIDASELLPPDHASYRYPGSLTTPPCSEGVRWIVLSTPITMSDAQIASFESFYSGNARPVQPLNDRQLLMGGS